VATLTIWRMTARTRRVDQGTRAGAAIHRTLAAEIRSLRLMAGLSQAKLADAVGISHAELSRIERECAPATPIVRYARLLSVLGGRLSVRVYPAGTPLRDEAHARLLARLRGRLAPSITMRTEVPLGIPGDLRAWDARLETGGDRMPVEAETALTDLQALDRRIALKMEDGRVGRVLLLVADTHRNRAVLREFGRGLAARYPATPREALTALAEGRLPQASCILAL